MPKSGSALVMCFTMASLFTAVPCLLADPPILMTHTPTAVREDAAAERFDYGVPFNVDTAPAVQDGSLRLNVPLHGVETPIELSRFSLRAPGFKVLAYSAPGVYTEIPAPELSTYRGEIAGLPGSRVYVTCSSRGVRGVIDDGTGELWFIQPESNQNNQIGILPHRIYRSQDVPWDMDHHCGVNEALGAEFLPRGDGDETGQGGAPRGGSSHSLCEIAFDVDYPYYQLAGGTTNNVVLDIESVMVAVQMIYERDVDITYAITTIVVRTSAGGDPYSATAADALLCQFRNEWNANQGGVPRDIAHLMTGRELDGSTIGIAWIGVVCNQSGFSSTIPECGNTANLAYGLSQSRFTGAFNYRSSLTAHELGHNWNACHCNQSSCTGGGVDGDCGIMNSVVQGSTLFGSRAKQSIMAHRDTRTCLSGYTIPNDDVYEENDSPAQSAPIGIGTLSLVMADADDYFSFSLCGSSSLTITATFDSAAVNMSMELLTTGGSVLNSAVGSGGVVTITRPLILSGTYRIHLKRISVGRGSYTLTLAGPLDCNQNGVQDRCDVLNGPSADCNNDLIPDECQLAANDCNQNNIPDDCEGSCNESVTAPSGVRFVIGCVPAGGDGLTWGTAFSNLQDALSAAASSSGAITEIWVAAGRYLPDHGGGQTPGDRNARFELVDGISIYGGFACGDDELSDRDPVNNVTILSGDLLGNDQPGFVNDGENSYHVVSANGSVTAATILDGFTISGGNTQQPAGGNSQGGGIFCNGGSPTIRACRITSNRAAEGYGGGVYLANGSPVLEGCWLVGNAVGLSGGAMQADLCDLTLTDCVFQSNSAGVNGGAFVANVGTQTLTGCQFAGNTSGVAGGAMMLAGGAVADIAQCTFDNNGAAGGGAPGGGAIRVSASSIALSDCAFTGNHCQGRGGAVYANMAGPTPIEGCTFAGNTAVGPGGAIHAREETDPTITNCEFTGNTSGADGGAIEMFAGSDATFEDCVFASNVANGALPLGGGAIHNSAGVLRVDRCRFLGNSAPIGDGGAIRTEIGPDNGIFNSEFSGNLSGQHGGAVNLSNSATGGVTHVRGCSFTANSAGNAAGAAIHVGGAEILNVTNSILWGNASLTTHTVYLSGGVANTTYSDLQGLNSGGVQQPLPPTVFNVDPRFVDADGADNTPGTLDDDLHLQLTSPCIDAGDPGYSPVPGESDIDGDNRVTACAVDMGVDEYPSGASHSGDVNGDALFNLDDLAPFVNVLINGGNICSADMNNDTRVDGEDIQAFVDGLLGN